MANEILKIRSVSQLHQLFGFEKPKHPLITVLDASQFVVPREMLGMQITSDLYYIAMKDGNCGMEYGRNHYDFDEGVLVFAAPGQVVSATKEQKADDVNGWMLFFHPDLIRRAPLGETIDQYTFFGYDVHEALHLSAEEALTLTHCVDSIKHEYEQRIDNHSQAVIISTLQLLLNYCSRYYERQFNTRTNLSKDVVVQVEKAMKNYFQSAKAAVPGPLSIEYLADQVHLSKNYLSDLLKKETGRSAKDHINDFVIEKAKYKLLASSDTISEIAYDLGFNYPHYFSRLFKSKTGLTPQAFRDSR